MKIRGKVEGLKEVLSALKGVEAKLARKLLRKSMGEAGKLILKRAKQLVPKESGLLKKSLGRKVKVYRGGGTTVAVVGSRAGFRKTVVRLKNRWAPKTETADTIKYAHLVERNKKTPSAQRPFLKPAADGQQQAIREAVAGVIRAGLENGK